MRILAPSEMLEKLKKNLGFKDDGSVEIAKNLEIDGKLKLNSGFEPIHIFKYKLENNTFDTLEIYSEIYDPLSGYYTFFGKLKHSNGESLTFGIYLTNTFAYAYLWNENTVVSPQYISYITNGDDTFAIEINAFALKNETQSKLLNHNLTLTANSKTYNITLQSTNNLKVDSIADLRTILNINATTDSLITPVCASDLTSTACLQVTTALCKIGADNVTAVSDKVTTL